VRRPAVPLRTIFLDCDSTLVSVEGIDELAARAGVGESMACLTRDAMNGRVPLEAVYGSRLAAVRPDRDALAWLAQRYLETLVDGARELVACLHALDKEVHVISGGLAVGVRAVAEHLGVPEDRVHAVPVNIAPDGSFAGFQEDTPLARSGGKETICRAVMERSPGPSAIVGDGTTDVEAGAACDLVVGFGGVAARDEVRRRADVYVEQPSLLALLPALTTDEELATLDQAGHGDAVRAARASLDSGSSGSPRRT